MTSLKVGRTGEGEYVFTENRAIWIDWFSREKKFDKKLEADSYVHATGTVAPNQIISIGRVDKCPWGLPWNKGV